MELAGLVSHVGARSLLQTDDEHDCNCHDKENKLGGVPVAAWIVLMFFAGVVVGSVATLYYQHWERTTNSASQKKSSSQPKASAAPVSAVPALPLGLPMSGLPAEFHVSPGGGGMGDAKRDLLLSPLSRSTIERAAVRGAREGARDGARDVLQALQAVQAQVQKDAKSSKGTSKDTEKHTTSIISSLKRPKSPTKEHKSTVAVGVGPDSHYSHSHTGASELVDTGNGQVQVQYAYSVDELDDEWRVVLDDLDKNLQQKDHPVMTNRERAVAIKYLLVATGSRGPETARESAVDEILRYRRFHQR